MRRAVAGAALVGLRGAGVRALALAGQLVLARFLAPRDFGVLAIGTTFVVAAGAVAGAGLGARLVNRSEPPRRDELESLLGIQLAAAALLAGTVVLAGLAVGGAGRVVALMVASLPVAVFRSPAAIVFEWHLDYRPIVLAELAEAIAFHAWAITAVVMGFGVWGVASAVAVRAATGTVVLVGLAPVRTLRPRFDWSLVRPLLAFGARYQAVGLVNLVREQALNIGTAVVAGGEVLGLWSLAQRLLQVPFLVFESLWRVSYPTMARLIGAGHDPAPALERGITTLAVGNGLMLAALVAVVPGGVPALLGPAWAGAAAVVPWAALGLLVSGPVSVASVGYLFAMDDAASVLRAVVLFSIAWVAVGLALLPLVGVAAVGIGWLVAALVEATVLGRRAARLAGARVLRSLAVPAGAGILAGASGWALAVSSEPTLAGAARAAAVAVAVYLTILAVIGRRDLREAIRLVARAAGAGGQERAVAQ